MSEYSLKLFIYFLIILKQRNIIRKTLKLVNKMNDYVLDEDYERFCCFYMEGFLFTWLKIYILISTIHTNSSSSILIFTKFNRLLGENCLRHISWIIIPRTLVASEMLISTVHRFVLVSNAKWRPLLPT